MEPPIDLLTAQQLLITSRSGPLVWPADTDGTKYDLLFACACTDLRLFYTNSNSNSNFKYAYANCAEHDWRTLGILLKPLPAEDDRRAERRRRSGLTTERWHSARGGEA